MTGAQSPLGWLVLFMICLAIASSFVVGVHWYAVDLPQQAAIQPPSNAGCYTINDFAGIPGLVNNGWDCVYYQQGSGGYYICCR